MRTPFRLLLCAILSLALPFPGLSQTWEQIRSDAGCLWGEGWGRTVEEADRDALAALGSRISVAVNSGYVQREDQRISPSGNEYASVTSSTLSLYSFTRLSNTNRVILREGRKAHVGRWIRRDELEGLFSDRKARVLEYESLADKAAERLRLDDALRYHYWAYVTLRSLARPSELRGADGSLLSVSIPEKINSILGGLVIYAKKEGNTLLLHFLYGGLPVQGLDFSYFDGAGWSRPVSVRKGRADAPLAPGALGNIVQLRIEYAYSADAELDDELGSVMAASGSVHFKKSQIIFKR